MPRFSTKKRKKEFCGIPNWKKTKLTSAVSECPTNRNSRTPSPSLSSNGDKQSSSLDKVGPSLDKYEQYSDDITDVNKSYNDIVNLQKIETLLSNIAVCVKCKGRLTINTSNRLGLSVQISVICSNCGFSVSNRNSDSLVNRPKTLSEINLRTVYGFRCIGKAERAANIVFSVMNLHKPPTFRRYNKLLSEAAKDVCEESMTEAAAQAVLKNDGNDQITGIFDGTWQRRGHSSLNGAVTALAANTGKVIDVRIFSKFCRCKNRLREQHQPNCQANYTGTSGGMEVAGVVDMFRQSEATRGVKYRYYLGDGDSAAFPTIERENPYGLECPVEKLECIGHVRKRMGTRLRKLKEKKGNTTLSDGKKIGGRGRLTKVIIDEIQTYYGLAILRNTDSLVNMKRAIWATYFHLASSDQDPAHGLCPKDPDTWCKFRKSELLGTDYKHSDHTHLPPTVMAEIKPIFRDLSQEHLLRKCLHGGTQNPCESLNSIIWNRLPKPIFVMKNTLDLGVYEAIATFNDGNITKCKILGKFGISPGPMCINTMKNFDLTRIKNAEKDMLEIEKKCRKQRDIAKKRLEDMYEEQEDPDNPSYGAGMH